MDKKQLQLDNVYLNIAGEMGSLSKCVSKQVGCVIVRDGRIISTGYNGTPANYHTECRDVHDTPGEVHSAWSLLHEIHAEMNALLFAAKNGVSVNNATMYCTLQPCWQCSKNIVQSGIKRVVFKHKYEKIDDLDMIFRFLTENQVVIEQAEFLQ